MVNKIYDIKERTYKYSLETLHFSGQLSRSVNGQVLVRQLIRSATSVGANVVEAQAGCSKNDFINYYMIALKSANESIYWLSLIKDTNPILIGRAKRLISETEEIAKILGKIIVNCKK